jgi:hypothetical protein
MKHLLLYLALSMMSVPLWASITSGEYFFNSDPGPGNGTAFAIQPSGGIEFSDLYRTSITIPVVEVNALPYGLNRLAVRTVDDAGNWSLTRTVPFYRLTPPVEVAGSVVGGEDFINEDPGLGAGTPFVLQAPETPGAPHFAQPLIPVSVVADLPLGLHRLGVRVQDSNGEWSLTRTVPFYRIAPEPTTTPVISRITYQWYQANSPVSEAYELTPDPAAEVVSLEQLASLQGLSEGSDYQLVVKAYDSLGQVSLAETVQVTVETTDSNGDGLPDQWKVNYGYAIDADIASLDSDGDELDALAEFQNRTNPLESDSDGDGLRDDAELGLAAFGFDPNETQIDLVTAFRENAVAAELYGRDQIGNLAMGMTVLEYDGQAGQFSVNVGLRKSNALPTFEAMPLNEGDVFLNPDGTLDISIDTQDETFFMLMEAK